jgi:hypothetical protein
MNIPLHELNKNSSHTAKLILITALMLATSASVAEESNIAYVDSVHKWGAWNLDIEPAAGGLQQPSTKALNTRDTKVVLRTNSFSALAPPASPKSPATPVTPIAPPVTPPIKPPVRPSLPAAPTNFAPPAATPTTTVTLPSSIPSAPTNFAPSGATPTTTVTLPPAP